MKQFKVHPVTSIFADVNADLEQITSKGRWSNAQKVELRKGLEQGVDVSEYANPRMNAKKMRCIRLYLLSGKTLDLNALIKMADYQLDEIDKGLESGVDVSAYADPKYAAWQMGELRKGLESGVDVSVYTDPKFDDGQMYQIRQGLESGIDVSVYTDPKFDEGQMKQIRLGLESGVDVSDYVDSRHEPKGRGSKPTSTSRKKRPDPFQQYVDKQGRSWTGEKL